MSRRPDPQRIDAARGAALWSRLTVSGIPEERADAWIDAWDAYATREGVPRNARYWQAGWSWIPAEREAGRRSSPVKPEGLDDG